MKFKATIMEPPAMREFMNIALSLSKFSKNCVMRITSKKVYFIVSDEEGGPRKPLVWCELPVSFYFHEFHFIGVNDESNEIYLEFPTGLLARSLVTLKQNVKIFKIKLTNKQMPGLTIEMEVVAGELTSRQIVHDIPVDVISRKYWSDYEEPRYDDFHVTMQLPNLKALKSMMERMRNLSHSLTVSANKQGRLTLQIETQIVKLSAHFTNLILESFTGILPVDIEENDQSDVVSSTVDIKKLLMFITGLQINNARITCSIVHRKMVKLFMEIPGALSIQIFLTELNL